jgi:YD repeat-containing protein
MRLWFNFTVLGFALSFIMGCASVPQVETEADPELNPQKYRTYFMLPIPTDASTTHRFPNLLGRLGPLAELAIDEAMEPKGYQRASSAETADLVLLVQGEFTPKSRVLLDESFNSATVRPGASLDQSLSSRNPGVTHRYNYDQARLVVEVHDRATERMVWVSWLERNLDKTERPEAERVAGNISRLLESFPVRP